MSYNAMLIHLVKDGPHPMTPFMLLLHDMVRLMARNKPDFVAVELGTNYGNSTCAIVSGLGHAGNGHLHSCDIVECVDAGQHVYRAGCGDRWSFYLEDSITLANKFRDDSVDFVFLDSSHEYDQTVRELNVWTPKLIKGGRLVAHDTLSRPDGVAKPIQEFLAYNHKDWSYYNIDVDCGLGVLTRL